MGARTLAEWLSWQESLHPRWIDLDLARVRSVASRLPIRPPPGAVFTVAGTNGKGSTVALLEGFLASGGRRVATYTSPHLLRYNERIRVGGAAVADGELIAAFEQVEAARDGSPLTFFEFGTLAALLHFSSSACDAWVLEVGMGGRLDAVNIVDADIAVITTIGLDHQEYLGDTIDAIAAEKAGIMRTGRPVIFGDWPVPRAIRSVAADLGARLHSLGTHFDFTPDRPQWRWRGASAACAGLPWPAGASLAQLRNSSAALAAIEQFDAALLEESAAIDTVIAVARQPGRFHVVERIQQWVLDVAHNAQAVETLRAQLETLPAAVETTIVIGILGDKSLDAFVAELGQQVSRWICCTVDDPRARNAAAIAARLRELGCRSVETAGAPEQAFEVAMALTPPTGRILVCGSFRIVGPCLGWLGIY